MPTHNQVFTAIRALRIGRSYSVPINERHVLEDSVAIYRGRTYKKRFKLWVDQNGYRMRVQRLTNRQR